MSLSAHDQERLRRAIALAAKGRFRVEPNPIVGCVIEREGRVLGEGWHDGFGGAHAEVAALAAAGEGARGATVFVSLEPCSRQGKTPPCVGALLAAGVRRVVFAASDPDPREGGGGAALRAGGVEVEGPALPEEGEAPLLRFRAGLASGRPWVVLKWAMSADGRSAPRVGAGGRLTGDRAQAEVHELRGRCDALLVGRGTLQSDDPLLTCRSPGGPPDGRPQPLRVVVARGLEDLGARRLFDSVSQGPVLIAVARAEPTAARALEVRGVQIEEIGPAAGPVDLGLLLARLKTRGAARVLVEGGARLHGAFLAAGLADQVQVWVAPLLLGGTAAVPAVSGSGIDRVERALRLSETQWRRIGDDLLLNGYLAPPHASEPPAPPLRLHY